MDSVVKTPADHQKSLDSLAKVVLDNRKALDYLLAERGGAWATANTACCNWINTSGETETQLPKITELGTWLRKLTPGFDSLGSDWSGSWGTQL